VITSGGRLVGTRGGVGTVVGMVGRSAGVGGVFGTAVPLGFGSFVPAPASGGVTTVGGVTRIGGFFVAGLNLVVVWQSAQVVGNVEWPGYVLESYSGR
jgi:hypothetical protein